MTPDWQRLKRPPRRRILRGLAILFLIYGCIRAVISLPAHQPAASAPAILPSPFTQNAASAYYLGGIPVAGTGTAITLGAPPKTFAPAAWLFGQHRASIPSCLTQPPPPLPTTPYNQPVRADLPGFYGAPWTASLHGTLIALLRVTAPRGATIPAPATTLEIYRDYTGQPAPDVSSPAAVTVATGTQAVLYRVFPTSGPVRCLDLVVPIDQPSGLAHLYYHRWRRYYEATARFTIQR